MDHFILAIIAALLPVVLVYLERTRKAGLSPQKLLPGPKGWPLIGSVPEVPEKNSFIKFHEWGQQYGPIYQVNLAGSNHVWISSDKIATDLLSKKSSVYSDRPFIPALEQDNRTSGQYLPLMSRNDLWLRQRKFAKQIMDTSAKASFYDYPELEAVRMLHELMDDASRYNHCLESFVARVTCRLAWGTSTPADELKQRARELLLGVSPTGALGNKLPAVMKVPEWLSPPKAWEARRSRTEKRFFEVMQERVANDVLGHYTGSGRSWMQQYILGKPKFGFAGDLEGAFAVGMHGIAGALTIAAPMQSFCLAMCHYPEYQPLLHEEIDRVCDTRLPCFGDMPDMPVLRAFIRETLRWRPPVPTGIPHESTEDDVYDGQFIPKGSIMHPLEWSISRDPAVFPDPDEFNPVRWLNPDFPTYREPADKFPTITGYSQFGYGRRVCQGMGVTEADLFVGIGSLAWLFDLQWKDEKVPTVAAEACDESNVAPSETTAADAGVEDALEMPRATPMEERLPPTPPSEEEQPLVPPLSTRTRNESGLRAARTEEAESLAQAIVEVVSPPTPPQDQPSQDATSQAKTIAHLALQMTKVLTRPIRPPTPPEDARPSPSKTLMARAEAESRKRRAERDAGAGERGLDPRTLDFSSLLIAKPLPFALGMSVRSERRAAFVRREWERRSGEGDYEREECFWEGGPEGNRECGWGTV